MKKTPGISLSIIILIIFITNISQLTHIIEQNNNKDNIYFLNNTTNKNFDHLKDSKSIQGRIKEIQETYQKTHGIELSEKQIEEIKKDYKAISELYESKKFKKTVTFLQWIISIISKIY